MMNTKQLARQLNAIERIDVAKPIIQYSKQYFDYLLVLDFEATCWDKNDSNKGFSEIIEFPCVLYDVTSNKILSEFQQYVMPFERPKLSNFCTQLTGIQQHQVDNGVPLKTCLILFTQWLNELITKYNITFAKSDSFKKCTFCTWSDWDLGTCLQKECRRKGINKSELFLKWVDVRALYIEHYLRRPKGLCGALSELGLSFEGNEHCGLHDARNTAKLIGRMIQDGVLIRITKDKSVN